ncbi:MAG: hydroxyacid dehydrogenase [Planctomycetota bacterium]
MNILTILQPWMFPSIVSDMTKARLKKLGAVTYRPDLAVKGTTADAYAKALADVRAEVVVTCWGSPKLTREVHARAPHVRYMCHLAGTVRDYVDREVIAAGLIVTNWGDVIARSVAEGALMMTLAGLRKAAHFQFELHTRRGWHSGKEPEGLFGRRVGLHGLGGIAQEFVKLLAPFGCRLMAYSPNCPDDVFRKLGIVRAGSLEELFAKNRVISVHASNTPANHHIINAAVLARLEDGGLIVNTARGAVLDTAALVAELKNGRIQASLDVYEEEPLPADSHLRGLENCLLIPHMGGPTPDRRVDMGDLGVANIDNFVHGRPVTNTVTAAKYDLIT